MIEKCKIRKNLEKKNKINTGRDTDFGEIGKPGSLTQEKRIYQIKFLLVIVKIGFLCKKSTANAKGISTVK